MVIARDGTIWFTDPPYGILPGTVEGHEGEQEYAGCYVFRYEPATDTLTDVIKDLVHPNGLAFSPDESVLYVADTAGRSHGVPLRIAAYDVSDGACRPTGTFIDFDDDHPADGLRVDVEGRIWTSAGSSVQVYSHSADLLTTLPLPEGCRTCASAALMATISSSRQPLACTGSVPPHGTPNSRADLQRAKGTPFRLCF